MTDGLHQLVEAIGLDGALRVIAAWGGLTLYVPDKYDPDHLITKVLGEDAAIKLELAYGGQTLSIPRVDLSHVKIEAKVAKWVAKGHSVREVAHAFDISVERAKQMLANPNRLPPGSGIKQNNQLRLFFECLRPDDGGIVYHDDTPEEYKDRAKQKRTGNAQ